MKAILFALALIVTVAQSGNLRLAEEEEMTLDLVQPLQVRELKKKTTTKKKGRDETQLKKIAHFQLEDETEVEFFEDEDEVTGETHMHLSLMEKADLEEDPSETERKKERVKKIKEKHSFVDIYEDLTGKKAPKAVKDAEKRRKKDCKKQENEADEGGPADVEEESTDLDASGNGNDRSLYYCYNSWWERNYCRGNEITSGVRKCQCYSCMQGNKRSADYKSTDFFTTAYAYAGDIQQRYYRWVDPWWRGGYWKRMIIQDVHQGWRYWAWAECYSSNTKWHAKIYNADSNDEYYWYVKWTNSCNLGQTPGWSCPDTYVM